MELSIIVYAYNMAEDRRLEDCLNSLLEQTIFDYEIIAIDDASMDSTSQILLDFAALYPDVFKVIQLRTHKGRGGVWNLGIKHARGKWLAFVEGQDRAAPTMYEKLLVKARETGADLVGCDYRITSEGGEGENAIGHAHETFQTGVLDLEKYKSLFLNFGGIRAKIYRRKIMLDCGMSFPEDIMAAEKVMECVIALRSKHFEYVPETLYLCAAFDRFPKLDVEEENFESGSKGVWEYCEDQMEAARLLLQYVQDFGYLKDYYKEIEYKYAELAYIEPLSRYLSDVEEKKPVFVSILKKEIKEVFPRFEGNPYYKAKVSEEKKRVIRIHQWSSRLLLLMCRFSKRGWKRFGIDAAGMVLGILLCLGFTGIVIQENKAVQYDVVILGDSLVANDYVGDELDEMLSKVWNTEVFNGGFGGTHLCNQNLKGAESYGEESLSLEELADSIVTGDFLVQKSVIKKVSKLDYYESRLDTLSKIDFEKTRILIIEHGVNDYLQQVSPAQVESTLRDVIIKLQKRYPDLQIWICSPTFCYIVKDEEKLYCDTTELGEFVLEEYILAEERVCKELGVGFVNKYHQDVITKETIEQYVLDGLHLNEEGRQIMAGNILEAMEQAGQ